MTAFEDQAYGWSGGVRDYQYLELGATTSGAPARGTVSFRVEQVGQRFLVTGISVAGP